jgi:hypothetical protein
VPGRILPSELEYGADGGKVLPARPMNFKKSLLFSTTHVISPLTPALSPLRGEGELSADFWQ